jgi:hypothetical protein
MDNFQIEYENKQNKITKNENKKRGGGVRERGAEVLYPQILCGEEPTRGVCERKWARAAGAASLDKALVYFANTCHQINLGAFVKAKRGHLPPMSV